MGVSAGTLTGMLGPGMTGKRLDPSAEESVPKDHLLILMATVTCWHHRGRFCCVGACCLGGNIGENCFLGGAP